VGQRETLDARGSGGLADLRDVGMRGDNVLA